MAEGTVSEEEYMKKLNHFVAKHTDAVKRTNHQYILRRMFDETAKYYVNKKGKGEKE